MPAANVEHIHRGICPCCGTDTACTRGDVELDGRQVASYLVKWTVGHPENGMGWLVSLKHPDTGPAVCIKVGYSFEHGSFMVRHRDEELGWIEEDFDGFGPVLDRNEVIGTPLATKLFEVLDDLWLTDPYVVDFAASVRGEGSDG